MVQKPTKDRGRSFLAEVELRPLSIEDNRGLEPLGLALGEGRGSLNILGLKKTRFINGSGIVKYQLIGSAGF